MKYLLSLFLLLPLSANALSCFILGADGVKYYKQVTFTKTLGTVATIKPCADTKILFPIDNQYGMKLITNEKTACDYVLIRDRKIVLYSPKLVNEVCP